MATVNNSEIVFVQEAIKYGSSVIFVPKRGRRMKIRGGFKVPRKAGCSGYMIRIAVAAAATLSCIFRILKTPRKDDISRVLPV